MRKSFYILWNIQNSFCHFICIHLLPQTRGRRHWKKLCRSFKGSSTLEMKGKYLLEVGGNLCCAVCGLQPVQPPAGPGPMRGVRGHFPSSHLTLPHTRPRHPGPGLAQTLLKRNIRNNKTQNLYNLPADLLWSEKTRWRGAAWRVAGGQTRDGEWDTGSDVTRGQSAATTGRTRVSTAAPLSCYTTTRHSSHHSAEAGGHLNNSRRWWDVCTREQMCVQESAAWTEK